MSNSFDNFPKFDGDISQWDVSMFKNTQFDNDVSQWDVSKVTDMFENSKFNGDISEWDINNVTDMSNMFRNSEFVGDISRWNTNSVFSETCDVEMYDGHTIRTFVLISNTLDSEYKSYSILDFMHFFGRCIYILNWLYTKNDFL